MMMAFPKSVFVLLPGVQDVKNFPIHYDIPFYSHFRVFVTANCVSFSVLEMNFWQYICMFRQKRSRIVENVYREYLYRSNRKFPQLCLLFLSFFANQRSVPPLSSLFWQRDFRLKQYQHRSYSILKSTKNFYWVSCNTWKIKYKVLAVNLSINLYCTHSRSKINYNNENIKSKN